MKIRNGFVSNSSSSSFVLITTVEHWDAVKVKLQPQEIAVAEAIKNKTKSFINTDVVSFTTWNTPGSSWVEHLDVLDGDVDVWDLWQVVLKALRADPTKVYEAEVEM